MINNMMNYILLFSFLFFCLNANYKVSALKCYSCSVNIGDVDQRCITHPDAVESGQSIVNCNFEFCTSKRVEYKDPPNTVHSMHRGCDSDPEQMNNIIEDDTYITYYRACRRDLCNGGSGKGSDNGGWFDPETGVAGVLVVRGLENSAPRNYGCLLIYLVLFLIVMYRVNL